MRAGLGDRVGGLNPFEDRTGVRYPPGMTQSPAGTRSQESPPLEEVAARSRPLPGPGERTLPAAPALAGLLPGPGLLRGTTLVVSGADGATSLVLSLLSVPSATGWGCAVVGMASLGLVAAAESGVELSRLALVPRTGDRWPAVVAGLLDALDVVVVAPPPRVRASDARRLSDRARFRGALMVVLAGRGGGEVVDPDGVASWPGPADLRLAVSAGGWAGLGEGRLSRRLVEVAVTGRGPASRGVRTRLWLPGERAVEVVSAEEVGTGGPGTASAAAG